jgi:hypothetical protein
MPQRVILMQALAPPKPAVAAPCNGCGLCCLFEPCPLGQLLSRRRRGACAALRWVPAAGCYRCGVLDKPRRWLPWLPARFGLALARRWIAAGQGCDCNLQASPAPDCS